MATRLSCLTSEGHAVFKPEKTHPTHLTLALARPRPTTSTPKKQQLLHPSPPRTSTVEQRASRSRGQSKPFPILARSRKRKGPAPLRVCEFGKKPCLPEGGKRDGARAQRDKEDRQPHAAPVHLLQAQGRPLQEGPGARRPLRRRPPPPPLLRLRQALPVPRAHRPLCQGVCREVRGCDAHQSLVRHPPGEARRAGEGGQDVRPLGEGAEVHDGERRRAVHGAVAGGAGAQPGGGHAQGALREGPQDRGRDELPREHDQGETSGALRPV